MTVNKIIIKKKDEIKKVERLLNKINLDFKLDEVKFVNLKIAVTEGLINAIIHGNKNDIAKNVYIEIKNNKNNLVVKIKDEGTGFDINSIPDPTSSENILKEHGRGIYIIKSLVDKFKCTSDKNGTLFILSMRK